MIAQYLYATLFPGMKFGFVRVLFLVCVAPLGAWASNSVVNLSHYDLMHPEFGRMKTEGIIGVIHEATFPKYERDPQYSIRQQAATRAGLLWGAYHYGDGTDPVRQADHFLHVVEMSWEEAHPGARPTGILLVLDFEKNGHYPGGSMRVDQAAAFVERIRERTGKYPGVYCSEYRIRQMLGARGVSESSRRSLTNCWLWIANYHYQPRSTSPWADWHLWQYTGDGKCDLPRQSYPKSIANIPKAERNIFRGSPEACQSFWQAHSWEMAPDLPGVKKKS